MSVPIRPPSILVAVDLRDEGQAGLRAAADLARATEGVLHVVHAEESGSGAMIDVQRETHEKRQALSELVAREVPSSVRVSTSRVRDGSAADVILEEAAQADADLIVLGMHRRRGIADQIIGSTAERVLRHATVPVFLANADLRLPVRRVLVPSDLSPPATRAIGAAAQWAARLSGDHPTVVDVAYVAPATPSDDRVWTEQEIERDLRHFARGIGEELGIAIPAEYAVLRSADPVPTLLDYARSTQAQMIVMGTRSGAVLMRAVLGSVSSAMIRRADLPVLLIPAGVGPAAGGAAGEIEPEIDAV